MVRALVGALAIIATACAPQQTRAPAPAAPLEPLAAAGQRLARGEFEAAASGLASAAATAEEPAATRYRLAAALLAADLGHAGALDAVTGAPPHDAAGQAMHGLALALQSVQSGDTAGAEAALEVLPTGPLTAHQRGLYLRTLGELQLGHGDPLAASANLSQAERYPMPHSRRTQLTHLLWSALTASDAAAPGPALNAGDPNAPGWTALLAAVRSEGHDPDALAGALADWQLAYPGHPAQEILIDALLEQAHEQARAPERIALLLPLEGALGGPAAAIRDGFLAMHFALGRGAAEPVVTVYSTGPDDVPAVAAQAVAAGADLIIGPLEKQAVQQLRQTPDLGAAVLALNTVEDGPAANPNPRFYQFGLRPEDEAVDLAERAYADGLRRMSAFVPNTELGSRLLRAFREHWQTLGGTLLSEARYVGEVDSYAAAVQQTLGLAESERRAASLRALLKRRIVSEPRRRPDLDGVMLAAYPVDARQIMPQFRYFGAGDLTVYATSQIFSGQVDPSGDQDLNGVTFGEMPWLLHQRDDELRRILRAYWQPSAASQRFFAFGADARRLVPYLAQMRAQPGLRVTGATGDLAMDAAGVVHRTLSWAVFRQGTPRPHQAALPVLPSAGAP